jgi:hypothetical protein
MALTIALTAFNTLPALAGVDSGGGDPLAISAIDFSDQDLLNSAISEASNRVQNSSYDSVLKDSIQQEIAKLRDNRKFLLLPSLIILSQENAPEGYTVPTDIRSFLALGGMTAPKKDAPIYFAERVLNYSTEKMTELLLHEVLHHVLPEGLTEDETFVTDLAANFFTDESDKNQSLALALETGVYPRSEYISFKQVLHFIRPFIFYTNNNDNSDFDFEKRIQKNFPRNIATSSVSGFIANVAYATSAQYGGNSDPIKIDTHRGLAVLAKKINPSTQ